VLGTVLHFKLPLRLFPISWLGHALGWPLIVGGIWISVRAAMEAEDMNIESPTKLLTKGPYSCSRNPMYVGWTAIYLGIALAANSVWIIALLPVAVIFTHFVEIPREERILEAKFGEEYLQYQERVRRYF
jgi:protein-S-isoprenylcysteine O-methyltransferase Ste14